MADETYVTNDAWVHQLGRPDLIDEVADQFERPVASGVESFWSERDSAGWPRTSHGWRSIEHLHHRTVERRAG
jgi:hypothetical protein